MILVAESLSWFLDCNKRLMGEVTENILDIECKDTINSQHVKDFERLWAFEDVTVSDHSEIQSNDFTIFTKYVENWSMESCFSTHRVWHSECKECPKYLFKTKVRLADELKNAIQLQK